MGVPVTAVLPSARIAVPTPIATRRCIKRTAYRTGCSPARPPERPGRSDGRMNCSQYIRPDITQSFSSRPHLSVSIASLPRSPGLCGCHAPAMARPPTYDEQVFTEYGAQDPCSVGHLVARFERGEWSGSPGNGNGGGGSAVVGSAVDGEVRCVASLRARIGNCRVRPADTAFIQNRSRWIERKRVDRPTDRRCGVALYTHTFAVRPAYGARWQRFNIGTRPQTALIDVSENSRRRTGTGIASPCSRSVRDDGARSNFNCCNAPRFF